MIRALYSAAAGMTSQQLNLDVISNNLANVNTTGFKKSKIEFQDLLYQTARAAGSEQGGGTQVPTGLQVGHGSRAISTSRFSPPANSHRPASGLIWRCRATGFSRCSFPTGPVPTRATARSRPRPTAA